MVRTIWKGGGDLVACLFKNPKCKLVLDKVNGLIGDPVWKGRAGLAMRKFMGSAGVTEFYNSVKDKAAVSSWDGEYFC